MLATVLEGKYELIRLVGEGGMGAVYEARHVQIGRHVAIKVMGEAVAQSEEARRRFLREAQVAGTLDHENICPVTDLGQTADGVPYLVMPLLKGHNLTEELESRQGPLPQDRSVEVVCQVLAGLEVAHAANILHRDLKPDNIFLMQRPGKADLVKLLDFGISKVVGPAGGSTELTGTGMVVGTPAYLAPEQAMATGEMDQRVDVYGAAVVLYQLLTGQRPFEARSYNEMIVKICTEPFTLPHAHNGQLDSDLERVLLRGMAREPDERWSTAGAFRQALLALGGEDGAVRKHSTQLLMTGKEPVGSGPEVAATQTPALQPEVEAEAVLQVATAQTVLSAQSADLQGLVQTPTAAGQVDLRASTLTEVAPRPRRGGLWGGIFALVGVLAGAGVVLLYLSLREQRPGPRPGDNGQAAAMMSPSPPSSPMVVSDPVPAAGPDGGSTVAPMSPMTMNAVKPTVTRPQMRSTTRVQTRPRPQPRVQPEPRPRPPSRPTASGKPSGGKTARLSSTYGNRVYKLAYMRAQARRMGSRVNRCYARHRFNGVKHTYATWQLNMSATGRLVSVRLLGLRGVGKGLNSCVVSAFHSISWKPPNNGQAGWIRLGYTSRIPRARMPD